MKTPGPYEAIVLADSITGGVRLTTLCCTFPRIVLAEFNTHRVFSRNSASSRAIPVKKRIAQIREKPYVPLQFGRNKSGMQARDEEVQDADRARADWLVARDLACDQAEKLADRGVHKQWANRLIEPFAWHTVIVSSTEWANYWALRISEYAQPEIRKVSEAMKVAMDASEPEKLPPGAWHLPLVFKQEEKLPFYDDERLVKLSVARCAAVSYERHMEQNVEKELARHDKLLSAGHMSPFEHAAQAGREIEQDREIGLPAVLRGNYGGVGVDFEQDSVFDESSFIGNFRAPWIQYRKMLPGEAVFGSEV